jgi:hypothetical protein
VPLVVEASGGVGSIFRASDRLPAFCRCPPPSATISRSQQQVPNYLKTERKIGATAAVITVLEDPADAARSI